ncbi:uncharacterized protein isoform X1 [Choristoneura fumiferana]|uniref:uncharacterized protein isoform X1 n=2 Tax=Choristoneura fumiferana TaxID=7141 RepID=UPI003D15AF8F
MQGILPAIALIIMKFLLAVALFALASALPEPVRLLEPVQVQEEPVYAPLDISPLMVPQEVMDEVALKVKVVETPEIVEDLEVAELPDDVNAYAVNFVEEAVNEAPEAQAAVEDVSAYAVNFVEEAVNEEAPEEQADEDVSAYAVNFVEEAVNEAPDALEAPEDVSAYAVNFVEEAVNAEAPEAPEVSEDASAYGVHFVEEPINAEAPIAIQIMQIPLPNSVVLPLDLVLPYIQAVHIADVPAEVSEDGLAVKFVDFADVDEETPSYMPIKQYPDPRWR